MNDAGAAQAITALIARYAELVDEGAFAAVGELFAHATFRAVVGPETHVRRGAEEVREQFETMVRTYDGIPATKHVTTNTIVEIDDGGATASARSYFSVLQARPDFPLQVVIAGRYHDAFACVDGTWRFIDRLVYSDLAGDLSRHLRGRPLI
jgi:3-phenylpropionate/cinnamic acid dioxygenase small subunit